MSVVKKVGVYGLVLVVLITDIKLIFLAIRTQLWAAYNVLLTDDARGSLNAGVTCMSGEWRVQDLIAGNVRGW